MPIKHGFTSAKADGGDATLIRPSSWNADHTIDTFVDYSTVRIFAGLTASAAAYVVASDTVLNNTCGLWHATTDPSSGANSMNFVTRDATTTTKTSIPLSNVIAAGNSYDFYMFAAPNDTDISYRLDDNVNGVTYEGSQTLTLPVNTVFMGPQCAMSNGTANTAVTTTAIGVAGVYTESDR